MRPLYAEVGRLRVVGQVFLARYIVAVVDADVAVEFVAFDILRLRTDSPCTSGVDIACYLQIHIVVDGEIVTDTA